MPYARNSDLPLGVRNALPDAAQTIFRRAFNSQEKDGLSEERSFRSAWGAVRNAGYRPGGEGQMWHKLEKQQPGMGDVHVDAPVDGPGKKKNRRKKPDNDMEHPCEAAHKNTDDVKLTVKIEKTVEDQRLVFGWLSIIERNGQPVVDLQGHVIEAAELEAAAYDFTLNSRIVGEMHERLAVGEGLVESMVFTKEKQDTLGIDLGQIGWWVGFKVDADVFAKIKSGELAAFSIGGKAVLEDLELPEAA